MVMMEIITGTTGITGITGIIVNTGIIARITTITATTGIDPGNELKFIASRYWGAINVFRSYRHYFSDLFFIRRQFVF